MSEPKMTERELYAFFNPCGNAYYSLDNSNKTTNKTKNKSDNKSVTNNEENTDTRHVNIDRQQLASLSKREEDFIALMMCPR